MSRKMENWQHLAQNSSLRKVFIYELVHWWRLLKEGGENSDAPDSEKKGETRTEKTWLLAFAQGNLMLFQGSNIYDSCGRTD